MADQRFFDAHRKRRAVAAVAALGLLGSAVAYAQDVQARQVAANEPIAGRQTWETHIAGGLADAMDPHETVIALYNVSTANKIGSQIGYAVGEFQAGQWVWSEGIVPLGPFAQTIDPSIAYDATNHHLLAAGFDRRRTMLVSSYTNDPAAPFEEWRTAVNWPVNHGMDKPWIVAGEPAEFYIVYSHTPPSIERRYAYLRTVDGGDEWFSDDIRTPEGPLVAETAERWIFPTVAADGTLYAVYVKRAPVDGDLLLGFIEGIDNVGGGVDFSKLMSTLTQELEVTVNRANVANRVPGGGAGGVFSDGRDHPATGRPPLRSGHAVSGVPGHGDRRAGHAAVRGRSRSLQRERVSSSLDARAGDGLLERRPARAGQRPR